MTAAPEDPRARFQEDGFVVLPRAVDDRTLDRLRGAIGRHVAAHDHDSDREVFRTDDRDAGREEAFFASARGVKGFLEAEALDEGGALRVPEEQSLNKIGHALHDLDPAFADLARSPAVRAAFEAGGLSAPRLVQTMVIFKQPGIGGEVRWHQDASYLITSPQRVVGIWIALEDADRDNGCLWMAPGAHRGPLRERYEVDWSTREGELVDLDATPWPADAVPLEVPAGSIVVFHDHMPHRSEANRSERSRVAVTFHAHDRAASWAAGNWRQRAPLPHFDL